MKETISGLLKNDYKEISKFLGADILKSLKAPFVMPQNVNIVANYLCSIIITFLSCVLGGILVFLAHVAMFACYIIFFDYISANIHPSLPVIWFIVISFSLVAISYSPSLGYLAETIKLELLNREVVMTPWRGNFFRYTRKGFRVAIAFTVYALAGTTIVSSLGVIVWSIIKSEILFNLVVYLSLLVILIFIKINLPFALIKFSQTNSISESFKIPYHLQKLVLNFNSYVIVVVFVIISYSVLVSIMGFLSCFVVGIFLTPLILFFIFPIIAFNLLAQIYKTPGTIYDILTEESPESDDEAS